MKINVLLGILVVALGYLTCKKLQKTASPSDTIAGIPDITVSANPEREPPTLANVPIDDLPPATASRKAYLSSGWWHLNMAFQPNDSLVHQNYQHKWLRFREDQTFDILIKNKVVDTGRWNWDEDKNELYFSCKDPYINNTWTVTTKGFVMILKGNTAVNVTGIQIRIVNSGNEPKGD